MALLTASRVTKQFGGLVAVNQYDFEIDEGRTGAMGALAKDQPEPPGPSGPSASPAGPSVSLGSSGTLLLPTQPARQRAPEPPPQQPNPKRPTSSPIGRNG